MVQLLWKTIWRFLKKLKIELLYDPAASLLSIYPKEIKLQAQKDICTPMFIAILFTIAKIWKQPVSINRRMDKEIVIHTCTQTMEHYLAITEENPAISDNIDET